VQIYIQLELNQQYLTTIIYSIRVISAIFELQPELNQQYLTTDLNSKILHRK